MFDQWHRVTYPKPNSELCLDQLKKQNAKFNVIKMRDDDIRSGCTIETPVAVSYLNIKLTNISYPQQPDLVALNCEFSTKLNDFITSLLIPLATKYFSSPPKAFLHKGGYSCRPQRNFTDIKSEHAFAQAIDFAGLLLEDGTEILVEDYFFSDNNNGKFFRELSNLACQHFGTNLGPNYDSNHNDHLHWAIGFPKICS